MHEPSAFLFAEFADRKVNDGDRRHDRAECRIFGDQHVSVYVVVHAQINAEGGDYGIYDDAQSKIDGVVTLVYVKFFPVSLFLFHLMLPFTTGCCLTAGLSLRYTGYYCHDRHCDRYSKVQEIYTPEYRAGDPGVFACAAQSRGDLDLGGMVTAFA